MTACSSCGKEVMWVITEASNKRMPLNPQLVMGGNVIVVDKADSRTPVVRVLKKAEVDPERAAYVSHFADCPGAATHRKR